MGVLLVGLLTLVQPTEAYKKKVMFLIDVSGSIEDSEIEDALQAFWMAQAPDDGYSMKVYAFDDQVYAYSKEWIQCPGPLDINAVCDWIRASRSGWKGTTNLAAPLRKLKNLDYSVVVITDGFFDQSVDLLRGLIKKGKRQVGFIGIARPNIEVLQELAETGRGGLRVLKKPEPKEPIFPMVPPGPGPIK